MTATPRRLTLALAVLLAAGAVVAGSREDVRADDAVRVVRQIQSIPEASIPDRLLEDAKAIVVVPDTIKAGFMLGGRRGLGLVSIKTPDGTWSNPVFVKLAGASFGLQAGVQSADVILVFRSERGLDSIVNGKVTLGADAGIAAGPVGRNAAAATDGQLKAEIWSWSRARGLFAGVSLDGAVLQMDQDALARVYGPSTTPRMVLEGRAPAPASTAVVAFRDGLEEASHKARAARSDATPAVAAPAAHPAAAIPATTTTTPAAATQAAGQGPQPTRGFEPVEEAATRTEPLP